MTSTEFKSPLTVAQDSRREVNGGNHTCYAFSNLDNIKNNDDTYAFIPSNGGIDSLRGSAVIYSYNYNFNIPLDATITNIEVLPIFQQADGKKYGHVTKMKILKLKTGASTTDNGVGNNLANFTNLNCSGINLVNGSKGDNVTELQTALKKLGYYKATIDGSFGSVTEEAVKAFQRNSPSLKVDGIFGPVTCGRLNILSCKIPIESWTDENTFKIGGTNQFSGDAKRWGVDLTPAIVNSTNFGCVFQVIGTGYKKWVNVHVAKIMMKIDYTIPGEVEGTAKSKQEHYLYLNNKRLEFDANNICTVIDKTLHVDKTDSSVFKVLFKHSGSHDDSLIVSLSSNGLGIGGEKLKSYTFPTIHFGDDSKTKEYSQQVNIYPAMMGGIQILTVHIDSKTYFIKFEIGGDNFTEYSIEKEVYTMTGQFCKITNCNFKNNTASYTNKKGTKYGVGGAVWGLGEHFQHNLKASNFSGNVALVSNPNLIWKKENEEINL